ncbi:MAG TPA: sugar transferase [Thermoanaerobaculia bacterium]
MSAVERPALPMRPVGSRGIARPAEAAAALAGLILTAPLIAIASGLILATSGRPVFFRQERVGQGGRLFWICKLRTMRPSRGGLDVTGSDDPRITRVGRLLRKTKIDEIPQLWNVLKGEMSLVGPRPEVPRYVDPRNPLWEEVLRVLPGMTDPVSVKLRNEEGLLAAAGGDRDKFYREELIPVKLEGYAAYIRQRSWLTDLQVIGKTLLALFTKADAQIGSGPERGL